MEAIYGMTLKAIDARLDATVVDTAAVLGDDGVTVVTPAKTALEIAESKGTTPWNLLNSYGQLKGLLIGNTRPNYKLGADGKAEVGADGKPVLVDNTKVRYAPDEYAQGKELYETKTLGEILDDFATFDGVQTFDKVAFFTNVVTNAQNVRTNTKYGYMLNFVGRVINAGWDEMGIFTINANGTYKVLSKDTPSAKYVDGILSHSGATGVKTFEVRASASVLWDVENVAIYNRIFATTTNTVRPGVVNEIVTGEDLIYVTIVDDASAQYVLKYDAAAYADGSSSYVRVNAQVNPLNGNNSVFSPVWYDKGYYVYRTATASVKDSWDAYKSYIFLDDVNVAAVEKLAKEAFATGNGLTELDDGTKVFKYTTTDTRIAVNPHYLKTPNGANKYERRSTPITDISHKSHSRLLRRNHNIHPRNRRHRRSDQGSHRR